MFIWLGPRTSEAQGEMPSGGRLAVQLFKVTVNTAAPLGLLYLTPSYDQGGS